MPSRKHDDAQWALAKESYMLGASIRDASTASGISQRQIMRKARDEGWASPSNLVRSKTPAAIVAAESMASRGEIHRQRIAHLLEQALAQAMPLAIQSWSDLEKATKIGSDVYNLGSQTPLVSIAFPSCAAQSTDIPTLIDISTNYPPNDAALAIED